MKTETPVTIRLKDYRQPDYWIRHTHLTIRIFDNFTQVESLLTIERNGDASVLPPLVLDGIEQEIKKLQLDDVDLDDFVYEHERLTVQPTQASFVFKSVTHIRPNENTSLEGLYKSGSMYCTQCEAEGFRKITFYLDRPDVMAIFTTRIEADKELFPILLANGNPIEEGDLDDGRHFIVWHDPFVKPSYLFAAVAGDLVRKDDSFTTMSGRNVSLRLFAEPRNAHKTDFAMESLKRSMKWDEERYGREYDLDIFMIVASDFFNMGAMENKGLNIFNSAVVLASEETSSDDRFERIEAIVAHEYFHNWSGNRVTCRDWFQLSLKEGFTVFRDSEFTADMHDRTVKRIKDATFLKNHQFPEDSGPSAHPVKPQEYMEINNFYTVTVYEKGAEVVGMIQTLIGEEAFRKGSDLYFERFDGQAVTTEDFVACMEEVSGQDLTQFKRWYMQAGTPKVSVTEHYDDAADRYSLTFKQICDPTPGQNEKLPFVIPVKMALLDQQGNELAINTDAAYNAATQVLILTDEETVVNFDGHSAKPIPSLFRDFSAPVRVSLAMSEADRLVLAQCDPNAYNRFDAIQTLYLQTLLDSIRYGRKQVPDIIRTIVDSTLKDTGLSYAIKANLLRLPSYQQLQDNLTEVDPIAVAEAREYLKQFIAQEFVSQWVRLTQDLSSAESYEFNAAEAGRRELQAVALSYWVASGAAEAITFGEALYRAANNQTDRLNGIRAVLDGSNDDRKQLLLSHFYRQWAGDTQMLETWLSLQGTSDRVTPEQIELLMQHEAFDITNPNKVRSLLGGYAGNFKQFHDAEGHGYQFLAEQIRRLNAINPQTAARLIKPLESWRRFVPAHSLKMEAALNYILETENLSADVLELTQKALG
ncbi:MAG: aminopeptidase N [Reinekea sp.]